MSLRILGLFFAINAFGVIGTAAAEDWSFAFDDTITTWASTGNEGYRVVIEKNSAPPGSNFWIPEAIAIQEYTPEDPQMIFFPPYFYFMSYPWTMQKTVTWNGCTGDEQVRGLVYFDSNITDGFQYGAVYKELSGTPQAPPVN
jgi:hypothetical protein